MNKKHLQHVINGVQENSTISGPGSISTNNAGVGVGADDAGSEKFQTGAIARFLITRRVDFGLQLGFDRECSVNSYGAGLDFKVYLLGHDLDIPVDLAIDGYYGHLRSKDYSRNVFGVGLLAQQHLSAIHSGQG